MIRDIFFGNVPVASLVGPMFHTAQMFVSLDAKASAGQWPPALLGMRSGGKLCVEP